jgi:hypothetical protein
VRFYVPEWDDHVDGGYDFVHDEHSSTDKSERNLQYIWDIFDRKTTPIDGVLISREQVEDTPTKFDRLTTHGVYDDPELDVPDWLPTISDCGAWGYKSLPFPPYGNEDMLEFYETLNVSVGVTIDHLVLGGGHSSRLYLNQKAFSEGFKHSDIPDSIKKSVDDIMVDEWPDKWPPYVSNYEAEITASNKVSDFDVELFEGQPEEVIEQLNNDSRAVYREDDMDFRYELTLNNANEMRDLYDTGEYSFRPMVAIQGWDTESYVRATEDVLDMGYQYIGIGGVAGSPEKQVKEIVSAVGNTVRRYEQENNTRVDIHVFGFAKSGAFEDIGRNGVASFDSASMLRAAWTGGDNYHLDSDRSYDALRIRYPNHTDSFSKSIEKALRGQEVLHALRAFDDNKQLSEVLTEWYRSAEKSIQELPQYLEEHRWDDRYDVDRLRDVEMAFREDYEHSSELKANFGKKLQSRLNKLLRKDNENKVVDWEEYLKLISEARTTFDETVPTSPELLETTEGADQFNQVWSLVESYAEYMEDQELLDEYHDLLQDEPWKECGCRICEEHGIEVAIFRGNNRNRRRGFHNTRRFYDIFEQVLPKVLVLTTAEEKLYEYETVEEYLRNENSEFWKELHRLPVVEMGVVTANGVHEWWEETSGLKTIKSRELPGSMEVYIDRYQEVFVEEEEQLDNQEHEQLRNAENVEFKTSGDISEEVHEKLNFSIQSLLSGYK